MLGYHRIRKHWKDLRAKIGYDDTNWLRVKQIRAIREHLGPEIGDVLEISPGVGRPWSKLPAASYSAVEYPDFDITRDVLTRRFDVVMADQVIEHLAQPVAAVRNVRTLLKMGGTAVISTPFLFRVHARPHDYYRWTAAGLRQLLLEGGFADEEIRVDSWGNKACAKAHIGGPIRDYAWGRDLRNDPEYPLIVWAFAKRLNR